MLSEREKRIIEIRGFIELAEETIIELIEKEEPLDDFEAQLLRAAIDDLEELKESLQKLKESN
ncbi:MAG: hypothetical protein AAF847_01780 [Bacteroidota bacterium]